MTEPDPYESIHAGFERVNRSMRKLMWTFHHLDYKLNGGGRRPDGRRRRTGHKHKGTRAWRTRWS